MCLAAFADYTERRVGGTGGYTLHGLVTGCTPGPAGAPAARAGIYWVGSGFFYEDTAPMGLVFGQVLHYAR